MINQEHFIEGFLKCLVEMDVVHLPGFGFFSCSYKSASIDAIGGLITPPTKEITFSSNLQEKKSSLNLISKYLGVNIEEVEASYAQLKSSWQSRLSNKEIVQLNGWGRLYMEYGGELKFKQELTTDIFKNDDLPILSFRAINRSQRDKKEFKSKRFKEQTTRKASNPNKKNVFSLLTNAELMPITIGVASFLLILVFYIILPKQPNFSNQSLAEKVKAERINQKPSHQLDAELAKDTFTEVLKDDKELIDEVSAVLDSENQNDSVLSNSFDQSNPISPKKLQQAIIITGAYKNIRGVKRKIKQFIALGYNPYQDIKEDLHRVGITFSYREPDELQEILSQIQETISPQAWILE